MSPDPDNDLLSAETLRSSSDGGAARRAGVPCLTIACHPDPARIGERMLLSGLLAGMPVVFSRKQGLFADARNAFRPLADPYMSRSPLTLSYHGPGDIHLDPGETSIRIDGQALLDPAVIPKAEIAKGTCLALGSRTLLWLHLRYGHGDQPIDGILGDSDPVRELRQRIAATAKHSEPVLICGETGSGKELVARALHRGSGRAARPFVAHNMATLTDGIAASVLFGHQRGAFTGADRPHRGLFDQADGGVLFLDEIGDTPASVQPILLRALETGQITPVGGERSHAVDVRVVAATDLAIDRAIQDGRFRAPLYHRLAGQRIDVPPLHLRRDDVGPLLVHFMRELLAEEGAERPLSPSDPSSPPLLPAPWVETILLSALEGNIRELRNLARGAARQWLAGELPSAGSAPLPVAERRPQSAAGPVPDSMDGATLRPPPVPARGVAAPKAPPPDEEAMLAALADHDFAPEAAARALGIASSSMHYFMRKSGRVRRATDLADDEILAALDAAGHDESEAARALRVGRRALAMTVRQRHLKRDE